MLMNTLGILVGFATVMLFFGLLVTTCSQLIQSALGTRARNLRRGVAWLVTETFKNAALPVTTANLAAVAANVVTKDVTWFKKDELISDLADHGVAIPAGLVARFDLQFEVMERYLSDQFTRFMQYVSIFIALAVVVFFQVSALDLLRRLSTDAELRSKLDTAATTLVAKERLDTTIPDKTDAETARLRLAEKHPELKARLEKLKGKDEADIVAEIGQGANGAPLAKEYLDLVDDAHVAALKAKLTDMRTQVDQLALFDLKPWPNGLGYYAKFEHCLGVLIAAVLVSLGAPFWYDALKNLTNLRDMLKPRP